MAEQERDGIWMTTASINARTAPAGSTPVSEEPAAGSTGDRELTDRDAAEVPEQVYQEAAEALVGGFRVGSRNAADAYGYAAAPWLRAAVDAAYARGISEGRRQATEGWEREWGAQYRNDSWVQATFDDQASATEFAAGAIGHRAVSRLVGPWEPADQPEETSSDR